MMAVGKRVQRLAELKLGELGYDGQAVGYGLGNQQVLVLSGSRTTGDSSAVPAATRAQVAAGSLSSAAVVLTAPSTAFPDGRQLVAQAGELVLDESVPGQLTICANSAYVYTQLKGILYDDYGNPFPHDDVLQTITIAAGEGAPGSGFGLWAVDADGELAPADPAPGLIGGIFEIDGNGDVMPSSGGFPDPTWELDGSDDIQCKEVA